MRCRARLGSPIFWSVLNTASLRALAANASMNLSFSHAPSNCGLVSSIAMEGSFCSGRSAISSESISSGLAVLKSLPSRMMHRMRGAVSTTARAMEEGVPKLSSCIISRLSLSRMLTLPCCVRMTLDVLPCRRDDVWMSAISRTRPVNESPFSTLLPFRKITSPHSLPIHISSRWPWRQLMRPCRLVSSATWNDSLFSALMAIRARSLDSTVCWRSTRKHVTDSGNRPECIFTTRFFTISTCMPRRSCRWSRSTVGTMASRRWRRLSTLM
mmetsp:Transcript_3783/g.9215  ORF Transcript_3783/g.9215 Transcript_3783/m.9215 type:complete len:270 (-) Transcript_3783:1718-2527(-)